MTDVTADSLGARRKRARFRAWHRGSREMDLILGGYADAEISRLDAAMLDRFEALMDEADTDLFAWVTGIEPLPETADAELIAAIAARYNGNSK